MRILGIRTQIAFDQRAVPIPNIYYQIPNESGVQRPNCLCRSPNIYINTAHKGNFQIRLYQQK